MSALPDFLRNYGPPIAWGLVLLGWFINNRHANRRERRKEIRSEIADLANSVEKVIDLLRQVHNLPDDYSPDAGLLKVRVVTALYEVDLQMERLVDGRAYGRAAKTKCEDCRRLHEEFFDLASGDKAFVVSADKAQREDLLSAAHISARRFIDALHKMFLAEFDE